MTLICAPSGVNIPSLSEEPCLGEYLADSCVVHQQAITALNLPANSSINTIITAMVLALVYKQEQIEDLQEQVDNLTPPE